MGTKLSNLGSQGRPWNYTKEVANGCRGKLSTQPVNPTLSSICSLLSPCMPLCALLCTHRRHLGKPPRKPSCKPSSMPLSSPFQTLCTLPGRPPVGLLYHCTRPRCRTLHVRPFNRHLCLTPSIFLSFPKIRLWSGICTTTLCVTPQ